jgi:hypothetical protein
MKVLKEDFIPTFIKNSYNVPQISQNAKKSPKKAEADPPCIITIKDAKNRAHMNTAIILSIILSIIALFQDSIGLNAHNNIAGTIKGIKTASK